MFHVCIFREVSKQCMEGSVSFIYYGIAVLRLGKMGLIYEGEGDREVG